MDKKMPKDPVMLLSFINTKLRDEFSTLEDFCKSMSVDVDDINAKLQKINYSYDISQNQFI